MTAAGLRKYRSMARTSLSITFVYRGALFLNLAGTLFYVVAMFYLWQTLFLGQPNALGGFTWNEMKAYILVSFLLNSLLTWYDEWVMSQDIREGQIAVDLTRPIDIQASRLARAFGPIGFELGLAIVVSAIVAFVFGGAALPADFAHAGLFVVSAALATLIKFGLVYCISMTAFWTVGVEGITVGRNAIQNIFSGALIPLAFFPAPLQFVAAILPFQGMISTPALIYLGKLDGPTTAVMLLVQLVWAVGLILLGRMVWRRAVRVVTIQGG
jgi:ABC-2 type transport system permease protein